MVHSTALFDAKRWPKRWTKRWNARLASCAAPLAALAALASPNAVSAQDQVAVPASTEVLQNIELTRVRDLDFGRIIVPRNGRVDMTADDASTCTPNNGLQLIDPCQSAQFAGQAATGLQLRISMPPGRRIVLTGPGQNLRLRRMTVGAGDGLNFLGRTNRHFDFIVTDPVGEFDFFVAGRMLFRNNQTPGVYTGTFTLEASYE